MASRCSRTRIPGNSILAGLSPLLSSGRRGRFFVQPETLLRWHLIWCGGSGPTRIYRAIAGSMVKPLAVGKKPLWISDPEPARLRRSDKLGGLTHEYRLWHEPVGWDARYARAGEAAGGLGAASEAKRFVGQMVSSPRLCKELGLVAGWPPPKGGRQEGQAEVHLSPSMFPRTRSGA